MNRIGFLTLFVFCCISSAGAQNSNSAGNPGAPIIYMDSKLFDKRLSQELESGKDVVEVEITGKMSLNNIGTRIDKWITVVGENGNLEVKLAEPAVKSRSFFSIASVVYSFVGSVWSERIFEPATNYNAVVYYRKDASGESLIDRVVFNRRR